MIPGEAIAQMEAVVAGIDPDESFAAVARAGRWTASVLLVLGLVGCSGPDTDTPVPTTAGPPFACRGVPERGAELMSGVDSLQPDEAGQWGPGGNFVCFLEVEEDGEMRTKVHVEERSVESVRHTGDTNEQLLRQLQRGRGRANPIEATQPGKGFTAAGPEGVVDGFWVCGDRLLWVTLLRPVAGRAPHQDVARYLTSMLPWACGGEKVPS
jgi:hypothetical protein